MQSFLNKRSFDTKAIKLDFLFTKSMASAAIVSVRIHIEISLFNRALQVNRYEI
jgi:hypothetical protein